MKAILISIKPRFVAKILNGEKTIEVRKSMPKCDLPIDVYIYCTKDKKHKLEYCDYNGGCWSANDGGDYFNGKVVAKFTLRKVEEIYAISLCEARNEKELLKKSCLTKNKFHSYLDTIDFEKGKHKPLLGYAYHIEDLVIFDKPKELKEFKVRRNDCPFPCDICNVRYCQVKRPPQSFMFIESQDWGELKG